MNIQIFGTSKMLRHKKRRSGILKNGGSPFSELTWPVLECPEENLMQLSGRWAASII